MSGVKRHDQPAFDIGSPRLGFMILSRAGAGGLRCFQRATIMSLMTGPELHGWSPLLGGGSVMLRYAVSQPRGMTAKRELRAEIATHGDIFRPRVSDGPASCAIKLFDGLRRMAALRPAAHFVAISDDDTLLNPVRLVSDLRHLLGLRCEVFYGQMAFAAGWSRRNREHYGWAPLSEAGGARLLHLHTEHRKRTASRPVATADDPGPFPHAMGYCAVLSHGLVGHVSASAAVRAFVEDLVGHERRTARLRGGRTPTTLGGGRGSQLGKCNPAADAALGWALAQLPNKDVNVSVMDVTYANRILPWRGPSARTELLRRAAVLHYARSWAKDFRWGLCASFGHAHGHAHGHGHGHGHGRGQAARAMRTAQVHPLAGKEQAAQASARDAAPPAHGVGDVSAVDELEERTAISPEDAADVLPNPAVDDGERGPRFKCRGAQDLSCGALGCDGPAELLHQGSPCQRDKSCADHFARRFAGWNFCVAVGVRRQPGTWLLNDAICNATEPQVLHSCQIRGGFAQYSQLST